MAGVSVLGCLDGKYRQRSAITNTDLYRGVLWCGFFLAFRLIEIPFLVNHQSESSLYLHGPCLPVKNSFVHQDMCKKYEGNLINFASLLRSHTDYDSLHLNIDINLLSLSMVIPRST